jgi:hypothetical protein
LGGIFVVDNNPRGVTVSPHKKIGSIFKNWHDIFVVAQNTFQPKSP